LRAPPWSSSWWILREQLELDAACIEINGRHPNLDTRSELGFPLQLGYHGRLAQLNADIVGPHVDDLGREHLADTITEHDGLDEIDGRPFG
jgi:hypothetical protein